MGEGKGSRVGRIVCAFALWLGLALAGERGEAAPGDLVWSFQTGGAVFGSPAMDGQGNLYVGSRDGRVYGLGPGGNLRWSYQTGDWVDSSPTLSHDETVVYAGSWDDSVYALSAATGVKLWSFATGSLVAASPALDAEGNLYFGSSDGFFYSLTSTGALRWSYFVGDEMDSSPAVGRDGSVYVGCYDGSLYALTSGGELRWKFVTEAPEDVDAWRLKSPPSIGANGTVYFGAGNGRLYAVSSAGQLLWSYDTGEKVDTGVAIDGEERLYFGSRNGSVYCLDANGLLEWESYVGDIFYSTPALDGAGRVYVGNYLGNGVSGLTALAATGEIVWEHLVLDYIDASPLVDSAGRVVFADYAGGVYAVEAGAGQAETDWSRFGGDRSNRSAQVAATVEAWTVGFGDWLELKGLSDLAGSPEEDSDGDGQTLALEYATGGDPQAADAAALRIGISEVGGELRAEVWLTRRVGDTSLAVVLELSGDLLEWQAAEDSALEVVEADAFGDGLFETVRWEGSWTEPLFARVRVAKI